MSREELWYCVRKSGVAEACVRAVRDMFDECMTGVRCGAGLTEGCWVDVGCPKDRL